MANRYDKIFKENIEPIVPFLIQKTLGLSLEKLEEMKDKIQTTVEREADFLKKVISV